MTSVSTLTAISQEEILAELGDSASVSLVEQIAARVGGRLFGDDNRAELVRAAVSEARADINRVAPSIANDSDSDVPTQEQLQALVRFAAANGRRWKVILMGKWETGKDEREVDGGLLRQVRNNLGPTWLTRFRLPTSGISVGLTASGSRLGATAASKVDSVDRIALADLRDIAAARLNAKDGARPTVVAERGDDGWRWRDLDRDLERSGVAFQSELAALKNAVEHYGAAGIGWFDVKVYNVGDVDPQAAVPVEQIEGIWHLEDAKAVALDGYRAGSHVVVVATGEHEAFKPGDVAFSHVQSQPLGVRSARAKDDGASVTL